MKRLSLFTILFLFISSLASAQSISKDDAALKSLVTQMADAQTAFDAGALDRILTTDYIEISPAGEFDPREKVLGFYKPELKPPAGVIPKVELSEFSIRNYGKVAVIIVKLTYMTMVGKTMPPRSMRATFVSRRDKSGWKIASAQYTGIRIQQLPNS
jgi:ketosteroid isomerase-like protein